MSQIISPSTGRLVTVGSDEFNELISSPRWSSHFTSPLTAVSLGTVRPMTVAPNSPSGSLPSLPLLSSIPVSTPTLSSSGISSNMSLQTMTPISSLPSLSGYSSMPSLAATQSTLGSATWTKSNNSTMIPPSSLPPLPTSPTTYKTMSLTGSSMESLHPVPLSPTKTKSASAAYQTIPLSGRSMAALPPVPLSPAAKPKSPAKYASQQKVALSGSSMAALPPVPVSPARSKPTSPARAPQAKLPSPARAAQAKSPGNVYNFQIVLTPPGSPMASLPPVPKSPFDLPTYDIPSLEEVLAKTKQPHLRKRLEEMIAEKRAEEGRGIKTRGWKARAPQKGRPRHELKDKCGNACFLDPQNEAYPICPTPELGVGCKIDCGGLQAAKVRASQYHKPEIAALADKLLKEKCPSLSSFTPKQSKK